MLRSRSVDSFSRIGTRSSHHSPTRPRRPGSFARFAGSQKFPAAPTRTAPSTAAASLRQQSGTPSLDHRNHRQLQQPSRPPSLSFARPDRTSKRRVPFQPPTRCHPLPCHHSHPSMTSSTSTNELLLIERDEVLWVSPFALDKEEAT
ncbi:hypothetical protein HPB52_002104 [Rhipicephalus sanguineus]|uniref:Uncharacterized protein n=1 Tax=Rhipicephalus sanguineus TaxID=34632 RepID=A0A9D4SPJ0_RHISA|nr:hypothetical protein HPB52_002104 [Rhipicephalus sanguineus]